jgi:hypothetical protein
VRAAGMTFNQATQFRIDVTADQLGGQVRSVIATVANVESDWQATPSQTFGFETAGDLEGWQIVQGTWTQATVNGGAGGTTRYVRSSTAVDGACDIIRSPVVRMNAASALSLSTFFTIEGQSGGIWYDRANVGLVNVASGAAPPVSPGTGRLYNASAGSGGCVNGTQPGWAGTMASWAASGWTAANLNPPPGGIVQLEVRYGTDGALALNGFRFDQVTLTNFERQVADVQSNVCCAAITVNPATIPGGTAGTAYSQTFTQTGGAGTITWSVTGALPSGITLNPGTGVLSGTPTQTGSFPITISAADGNGCPGSRGYTLVIGCQTLGVNPATIPSGTAGAAYSQTFTQAGGIGTITWSVTGTLPAGLTLDTSTGVLSGTPTQHGSFPITVSASDANSCGGSRAYTLVIDRAGPFVPLALAVDADNNGVLEPGETVGVAPTWRNDTGASETVTGTASSFTGPAGGTYTISDASASYGTVAAAGTASCEGVGECYAVAVAQPGPRPVSHWDTTVVETLSSTDAKTWTLHVGATFTDVTPASGFYRFVETIVHKNVTGGCTASTYCPGNSASREQMAVFVLVSKEAPGYTPPACTTPMFADVPASSPFCRWIEELARRGVAGGCGGGNYCPSQAVTREQMAVFVLRTLDPTLDPPACTTPMFNDVAASSPFCRWIEELARRGVVTGCGGGNYCPGAAVTREQMSVFLTVTFGLTLYGV